MKYQSQSVLKFVEEDVFEGGCLPHTGHSCDVDIVFKGETAMEVVDGIKDFFSVQDASIELNACDEPGRVDVELLENGDADPATEGEIKKWKEGKLRLWSAIYSIYIIKAIPAEL